MTMYQDSCGPTQTPDDIDIDALREKYRQEREKRLRKEGSKQYLELEDDFAEFYEVDPHTPVTPRTPIAEDIDVAVLGGGFGGLLSAAYLKKAGVDDVRHHRAGRRFRRGLVLEPLSRHPMRQRILLLYPAARRAELHPVEEVRRRRRDLSSIAATSESISASTIRRIFSTQVREAALGRDDQSLADQHQPRRRHSGPLRGDGAGPFNRPKLPGIPGIQDFKGHSFHSARGGTTATPAATPMADWTSWQTSVSRWSAPAPRVSRSCRSSAETPSTCTCSSAPRPSSTNAATAPPTRNGSGRCSRAGKKSASATSTAGTFGAWRGVDSRIWCATSGPNWVATTAGSRLADDPASLTLEQFMAIREEEDYKLMERLRRRIEELVEDDATAEALKPYYRFLCKRPCSNDDYLPAFNRPNVTLVDVSSQRRRTAHREGAGRQRRGIRGRLHHLRQRL